MRSILVSSLVGVVGVSLFLGGCAVSTTEDASQSNEAVSATATRIVGAYQFGIAKGNYEEYDHLTLDISGSYTADKPSPTHGAPIPESGVWTTTHGGNTLVLSPSHASNKRYDVTYTTDNSGISLTRSSKTEIFTRVATSPVSCTTNADCASNEECRFVSVCPNAPNGITCHAGRLECVTVAHYNESCGGFTAHPIQCATGLTCTHVAANGSLINPDLPGVCLADVGSTCGGNMLGAHACASPYRCVTSNPDVAGVCAE